MSEKYGINVEIGGQSMAVQDELIEHRDHHWIAHLFDY